MPYVGAAELAPSAPTPPAPRRLCLWVDLRALQQLAVRQAAPSVGAAELPPSAPTPPAPRRLHRRPQTCGVFTDASGSTHGHSNGWQATRQCPTWAPPSWRHPHRRPQPCGVFTDASGSTHGHSNGWQAARWQRPPWAPPSRRHPFRRPQLSDVFSDVSGLTHGRSNGCLVKDFTSWAPTPALSAPSACFRLHPSISGKPPDARVVSGA